MCAVTSAMWTHRRMRPSSRLAEIASSKSRADTGSIVNVGSAVRSIRSNSRRRLARVVLDARGKLRRRPRSTMIASITSRATSGSPSGRTTRGPRLPPPTRTIEPGRAPCVSFAGMVILSPRWNSGVAVMNRPRLTSTHTTGRSIRRRPSPGVTRSSRGARRSRSEALRPAASAGDRAPSPRA